MTEKLAEALARVRALPDAEQDAIAAIILDELEDEERWDQTFRRSRDLLAKLAAEALAEYRAGQTRAAD